jgi:protein-tyrosine phosphatase
MMPERKPMPLDVNRITENLYQGSNPPHGSLLARAGFHTVVLCAMERQYPASAFPGVQVIHAPMDDGYIIPPLAAPTARLVAQLVRRGKKVLVVCNMGLNRSGITNALALWYLTGMSGHACMWHVQTRRPGALFNNDFAAYLSRLLPRKVRRHGPAMRSIAYSYGGGA